MIIDGDPGRSREPRRRPRARDRHGVPGPAARPGAHRRREHRPGRSPDGPTLKLGALSAKIEAASQRVRAGRRPDRAGAPPVHRRAAARRDPQGADDRAHGSSSSTSRRACSRRRRSRRCSTVIASLRDQGLGIVLVTHKLNEVRAIADRVTVLRGGQAVLDVGRPDAVLRRGARRGDGRSRGAAAVPGARAGAGERARPCSSLQGATALGDRGHVALHDVDLEVHPGELVGVAGVAGSGQRELCEVALGLRPVSARLGPGRRLAGVRARSEARRSRRVPWRSPRTRSRDSVVPGLSVLEHMVARTVVRSRVGGSASTGPRSTTRTTALDERAACGWRRRSARSPRCPAATSSASC